MRNSQFNSYSTEKPAVIPELKSELLYFRIQKLNDKNIWSSTDTAMIVSTGMKMFHLTVLDIKQVLNWKDQNKNNDQINNKTV